MADLKIYKVNELPSSAGYDEIYFEKKGATVQMSVTTYTGDLYPISSVIQIFDSQPDSLSLVEGLEWFLRKPSSYERYVYIGGEVRLREVIPI